MRDALYHLERSRPASLQAQIREILVEAIRVGQLKPGDPVPSTRAMAARLGVSRNTVTLAYQGLVAESFLASRERSGFFVDESADDGLAARPRPGKTPGGTVDWDIDLGGSAGDLLASMPLAVFGLAAPDSLVRLIVFAGFAALAVVSPISVLAITAMDGLEILVAFIQAYVFTILTCVYLKDALHPHH